MPAIYEHKAALIGRSPSQVCRNADYLYAGLKQELAIYDPDMLVVGVDVYNVEAEAMGCRVIYFEDTNDCPGIIDPLIKGPAGLDRIGPPDPERDGRMPILLDVAEALCRELGGDLIIRGAVTGPFSLASHLIGAEKLFMAAIEDPAFTRRLLDLCARVTVLAGKAFLRRGAEPIIFDSRATPRLTSPRVFSELIKPVYRDAVFPELKRAGAKFLPLIIGGDTTPVIDDLIQTGAGQILCDPPASLEIFGMKCQQACIPFRANVDARLVNMGPPAAVRKTALSILRDFKTQPGFLMGCGVVGYDCDRNQVLAIRQAIEEIAAEQLVF